MDESGSTRDEPFERSPAGPSGVAGCVDLLDPGRALAPADLRWLHDMAAAAAAHLRLPPGSEVRVRIVRDAEMAEAHERYKGVPGTTDVLTFDLSSPGGPLDADLLICSDEAARQAAPRGIPVAQELLLYIVHGMLHCLSYDDVTPDGAAAMHAREDEVLEAIGVGATYAAPAAAEGEVPA
jgi:probable rRNA maturation factor